MPNKNRVGGLAVAAVVALALAACTSHATTADKSGPAKTSLTVAVAATPTSYDLDGSWAASNENYTMWSQTQIGLLNYKTTTKNGVVTTDFTHFVGALADEKNPYTVSDDGQTYTFHLRKGVKSQAGNPFTGLIGLQQPASDKWVQADADGHFTARLPAQGLPIPGTRYDVQLRATHGSQSAEESLTLYQRQG